MPPTTIRRFNGSPLFTSFLLSCAEILNIPTPPEKFKGRLGKGSTCIVRLGALISFFTST